MAKKIGIQTVYNDLDKYSILPGMTEKEVDEIVQSINQDIRELTKKDFASYAYVREKSAKREAAKEKKEETKTAQTSAASAQPAAKPQPTQAKQPAKQQVEPKKVQSKQPTQTQGVKERATSAQTSQKTVSKTTAEAQGRVVRRNPTPDEQREIDRKKCLAMLKEFDERLSQLYNYDEFDQKLEATITFATEEGLGPVKDGIMYTKRGQMTNLKWAEYRAICVDNISYLKENYELWETSEFVAPLKDDVKEMYNVLMSDAYADLFKRVGLGQEFASASFRFKTFYDRRANAIENVKKYKNVIKEMEKGVAQVDEMIRAGIERN